MNILEKYMYQTEKLIRIYRIPKNFSSSQSCSCREKIKEIFNKCKSGSSSLSIPCVKTWAKTKYEETNGSKLLKFVAKTVGLGFTLYYGNEVISHFGGSIRDMEKLEELGRKRMRKFSSLYEEIDSLRSDSREVFVDGNQRPIEKHQKSGRELFLLKHQTEALEIDLVGLINRYKGIFNKNARDKQFFLENQMLLFKILLESAYQINHGMIYYLQEPYFDINGLPNQETLNDQSISLIGPFSNTEKALQCLYYSMDLIFNTINEEKLEKDKFETLLNSSKELAKKSIIKADFTELFNKIRELNSKSTGVPGTCKYSIKILHQDDFTFVHEFPFTGTRYKSTLDHYPTENVLLKKLLFNTLSHIGMVSKRRGDTGLAPSEFTVEKDCKYREDAYFLAKEAFETAIAFSELFNIGKRSIVLQQLGFVKLKIPANKNDNINTRTLDFAADQKKAYERNPNHIATQIGFAKSLTELGGLLSNLLIEAKDKNKTPNEILKQPEYATLKQFMNIELTADGITERIYHLHERSDKLLNLALKNNKKNKSILNQSGITKISWSHYGLGFVKNKEKREQQCQLLLAEAIVNLEKSQQENKQPLSLSTNYYHLEAMRLLYKKTNCENLLTKIIDKKIEFYTSPWAKNNPIALLLITQIDVIHYQKLKQSKSDQSDFTIGILKEVDELQKKINRICDEYESIKNSDHLIYCGEFSLSVKDIRQALEKTINTLKKTSVH